MKDYNFIRVKNGTKKAAWVRGNAIDENFLTLENSYFLGSENQIIYFKQCKQLCQDLGGKNFHIVSFKNEIITVAFYTDNAYYLLTPYNNYKLLMVL